VVSSPHARYTLVLEIGQVEMKRLGPQMVKEILVHNFAGSVTYLLFDEYLSAFPSYYFLMVLGFYLGVPSWSLLLSVQQLYVPSCCLLPLPYHFVLDFVVDRYAGFSRYKQHFFLDFFLEISYDGHVSHSEYSLLLGKNLTLLYADSLQVLKLEVAPFYDLSLVNLLVFGLFLMTQLCLEDQYLEGDLQPSLSLAFC